MGIWLSCRVPALPDLVTPMSPTAVKGHSSKAISQPAAWGHGPPSKSMLVLVSVPVLMAARAGCYLVTGELNKVCAVCVQHVDSGVAGIP